MFQTANVWNYKNNFVKFTYDCSVKPFIMEIQPYSVSGLYYKYKQSSDDEIKRLLDKVLIVKPEEKSDGKFLGYYPLKKKCIQKIKEKPRNVSLTFDAAETVNKPVTGLKPYMKIAYLVKSSSRFFLKPDFGEIVDQMPFDEMYMDRLKAIAIEPNYETLPDTDGEHFLMCATLLTNK